MWIRQVFLLIWKMVICFFSSVGVFYKRGQLFSGDEWLADVEQTWFAHRYVLELLMKLSEGDVSAVYVGLGVWG